MPEMAKVAKRCPKVAKSISSSLEVDKVGQKGQKLPKIGQKLKKCGCGSTQNWLKVPKVAKIGPKKAAQQRPNAAKRGQKWRKVIQVAKRAILGEKMWLKVAKRGLN